MSHPISGSNPGTQIIRSCRPRPFINQKDRTMGISPAPAPSKQVGHKIAVKLLIAD